MAEYSLKFFANALAFKGQSISAGTVSASLGYTGAISLLKVMTLPRPPVLLSPLGLGDGEGVPIQNVQLSWRDPGIPNYNQATTWQVNLTPGGFASESAAPSTEIALNEVLLFGTSYEWSAQAFNEQGSSGMASTSFRTLDPPAPTHLSPNNQSNIVVPVVLTWIDPGAEMGSPALHFNIQVSGTFAAGTASPLRFTVQQGNFTVPEVLVQDSTYTWEVSSQYPPGSTSSLSLASVAAFTTEDQ
jgi:hypothetical protein